MKRYPLRGRGVSLELEALEERRVLSTASYVSGLYTNLLNRSAGPGDIAFWGGLIDQGTLSPAQVAGAITTSVEFRTDTIVGDYQQLLGRTPSSGEVGGWVATLEQGLPERQVIDLFLASPEYFQDHGGNAAGWLNGVYQDELGRAPDAAGAAAWLMSIQGGASREAVADSITSSPEALARVATAAYESVLGRAPDPSGLAFSVGALARGEQISQLLASLAASAEYINAHGGLGTGKPAPGGGSVDNGTSPSVSDTSGGDIVVDTTGGSATGIVDDTTDIGIPPPADTTDPGSTDTTDYSSSPCDCNPAAVDDPAPAPDYSDPAPADTSSSMPDYSSPGVVDNFVDNSF